MPNEAQAVLGRIVAAIVKQAEMGLPEVELIRRVGISEQTFYRWKKQYAGLEVDQLRQLKQLQDENGRLKKLVAELEEYLRRQEDLLHSLRDNSMEEYTESAHRTPTEV